MKEDKIIKIINEIYKNVDPMKVSINYRESHNLNSKNFVYGEVVLPDFLKILEFVKLNENDIFYDLGSGSGKAVISSFLYKNPKLSIGIEYIPDLVGIANSALRKLEEKFNQKINNVKFINEDIRNYDFSDGNVFFLHCTTWEEELMENVEKTLIKSQKGSRIITVTKQLKNKFFKNFKTGYYKFTWGTATVNFYEKI